MNFSRLGSESLKKLEYTTARAEEIQNEVLLRLMQENKDSAYGQIYHFSEIRDFEEFQKNVPISDYEDYRTYVNKVFEGEKKQLTVKEPCYYCLTSGSAGEPKYQLLTEDDLKIHYDYAYGAILGIIQKELEPLSEEEIFGNIFQVGEFVRTFHENGVMNGIRSSSVFQWLDKDGDFDASNYCVPKEVLFPDTVEELTYLRVRFALAQPDITAIHGVFIHRLIETFQYIEKNWELLLHDMETGTVDESISISPAWKEKLEQWLPANPARAEELRSISKNHFQECMIKKLWKNVTHVLCIGGSTFSIYMKRLQNYMGDIPVHYYAYASSEGIFGIAPKMDCEDQYVLLPEAGIFEFLPVNEPFDTKPLLMAELKTGEKYELIFTNLSGLYRYRMMDVLEVVDFYGTTPIVRFCYRLNQLLNVANEKLDMEQMENAISLFHKISGKNIFHYCVQEDYSTAPPRYLIYIEGEFYEQAETLLEECMCRAAYAYECCRHMGEIGPLHIQYVTSDSFLEFVRLFRGGQSELKQVKPIWFLRTTEEQKYFRERAVEEYGEFNGK